MTDEDFYEEARRVRDGLEDAKAEVERARSRYHEAIRRAHAAGGSLREIAEALQVSHQRVHQIVNVPNKERELRCSFCGRSSETRRCIAGPGVAICERCLGLANEVAVDGEERADDLTRLTVLPADARAKCSFCRKKVRQVYRMVAGPRARICTECLDLCNEIFDEELNVDSA